MEVKFLGEGELPALVEEIVSDSIEVSIASAFLNFTGLSILEKYLKKYNRIKSIQILLDKDFHPDEQVKKTLLSRISGLPNTEVRVFCDDNKLFHAKIYCFRGAEKIEVVVGSSNLTGGGFFHNVELNALFVADIKDPEIVRLNSIYREYWAKGIPAKDFVSKLEGSMSIKDFNIGDKVIIGNKMDLGIGKIVEIEGNQADIYFKEKGIAETAHLQDIQLALDPIDMAKEGRFDNDPVKFDLRTRALFLPMENTHGILSNSVIEILPHQILAAHKVITSDSRRFLMADEVGLGKTFEAGIIIKELVSRGEAERVLIVTPAGLVEQWQEDMAKFGFDFTIYRSGMESAIKDFWNKMSNVIASIDTIKVEEHLQDIINANEWDILVFDEAHHLTRKDYGLKADKSDRYIVGERLKGKTETLLFLTATPHQGDRNKFYNLVNLLYEALFEDDGDLFHNRERLNQIMIRQRKIDASDEEGKPLFVKRIVNALRYATSEDEDRFFKHLHYYLIKGYKIAEQDFDRRYRALGFVMTTFQKIAASSIYAVKMALEERLIRLLFIEIAKSDDDSIFQRNKKEIVTYSRYKYDKSASDVEIFSAEKLNFEKYIKKENIDPLEFVATPDEINLLKELLSFVPTHEDTKLIKLLEDIKAIKEKYMDEKFIIFTEYLNTQDYIVKHLREMYSSDDVVFIRGGDHQEKVNAAKAFKKTAHFLVSTQAGGEGINLQHCHIIINYDMPWNPMKVEQRIGRIHRYKQKDTAQIYNMFAADTIEDRIYQRLNEKLYEISQTIGNEDEKEAYRENILGMIAEELSFDELYKEVLRRGQQVDELTKEKIDAAIERAKEVYHKLGDFTQDLEKFNLEKYFQTKGNVTLEDVKKFILDFVKSEGKKITTDEESNYEFIIPEIIQIYGGRKYKRITFDREKAIEDPSLEFMAIGHHITNSIIEKCSGYSYAGRCAQRQISNAQHKGEEGIQFNFTIEYQSPQPGQKKNRMLQRNFQIMMFDTHCNYRKDLEKLGLIESQKKISVEDFSFATKPYLEEVNTAAHQKLQEIIEENINTLRAKYPNVVYKKNLENVALFVVK
jgi:superfamily II DNA or RNA helicase/HKD family nuclease